MYTTTTSSSEIWMKNKISTRVVGKTTFRIYFPRNSNADLLFSTSEPLRSTSTSSIDQDVATSTQGPPLLSIAFSPSLPTMLHDSIWIHYV